jgi:hypothetical protein
MPGSPTATRQITNAPAAGARRQRYAIDSVNNPTTTSSPVQDRARGPALLASQPPSDPAQIEVGDHFVLRTRRSRSKCTTESTTQARLSSPLSLGRGVDVHVVSPSFGNVRHDVYPTSWRSAAGRSPVRCNGRLGSRLAFNNHLFQRFDRREPRAPRYRQASKRRDPRVCRSARTGRSLIRVQATHDRTRASSHSSEATLLRRWRSSDSRNYTHREQIWICSTWEILSRCISRSVIEQPANE